MYKDKKGLWRQQVTINGKRKVFSARTKKDLMLKIATYKNEELYHTSRFRDIAEQWEEWKQDKVSRGTWRCYNAPLQGIIEHFGDMEIGDISGNDVQKYLNGLGLSYKSTLTRKGIISQIFDYAIVELDMDLKNPCDRVRIDTRLPRGHRDALSPAEIQAIRDTSPDEFLLAPLILFSGLRTGEALCLTFGDIDFKKKVIHVSKSIDHLGNRPIVSSTKTINSVRDVPLLPQLEALLPKKYRKTDYVVSGAEPLTKSALNRRWQKWEAEHGVNFDRHSIRHTYATILYESGVDVKSAQRLLGHANFQTTMDIYTHLSEEHLQEASQKLADHLK